jgi:L-alanine-DL-glutamate epimerase-like enolase superfamily enzyme
VKSRLSALNSQFEKGFLIPPQKPGFGVELDPAALQRFALSETEDLAIPQPVLRAS